MTKCGVGVGVCVCVCEVRMPAPLKRNRLRFSIPFQWLVSGVAWGMFLFNWELFIWGTVHTHKCAGYCAKSEGATAVRAFAFLMSCASCTLLGSSLSALV